MPNVRTPLIAMPCALLALMLSACNPFGADKVADGHSDAEGNLVMQHRPDPRRAYRITMTITDAPGPFASVQGVAQYDVVNSDQCGRRIPFEGVTPPIGTDELFVLTKVSADRYEGTVYPDLMLDEDYYGRGVCRWTFTGARVLLMATGDRNETVFIPDIASESILEQASHTEYFWNQGYPRSQMDAYPDGGEEDVNRYRPEIRDELFDITLSASEVQP